MFEDILARGETARQAIERIKREKKLLFGFGHRIYKTYDPRAKIVKKSCMELLDKMHIDDPLLATMLEMEELATHDDYFLSRHLYPNVDFYSGVVYRAIGIPKEMFTVMFALGRLPGWIAHWMEALDDPRFKLQRPRQVYVGPSLRHLTDDECYYGDQMKV